MDDTSLSDADEKPTASESPQAPQADTTGPLFNSVISTPVVILKQEARSKNAKESNNIFILELKTWISWVVENVKVCALHHMNAQNY